MEEERKRDPMTMFIEQVVKEARGEHVEDAEYPEIPKTKEEGSLSFDSCELKEEKFYPGTYMCADSACMYEKAL
jgi:hypothetical protein